MQRQTITSKIKFIGQIKKSWTRSLHTSSNLLVSFVYKVTVKTGDKFGAGTDSNIYLRMIGALGSTDEIMIETSKNELERGTIDHYNIVSDDVGALQKIIIRHDNSGFAPGWYLDWISISDGMNKKYNFKCDDWLIKDESFGNIKLLKEEYYLAGNTTNDTEQNSNNTLGESNKIDELILSDLVDLDCLSVREKLIQDRDDFINGDTKYAFTSSQFVVNMMALFDSKDKSMNNSKLKFNKIELPHLVLSMNCPIESFITYTKLLEPKFYEFSRSVVLSQIFFKALRMMPETFNNEGTLEMLVFHNGSLNIIKPCKDDISNIYKQFNEINMIMDVLVIPKYGLNIIDTDSVCQLSQVLRAGQLVCLNIGAIQMGVDTDKELSKFFNISISCDSRFLSEEVCASLLYNCKKFIVNPELLTG